MFVTSCDSGYMDPPLEYGVAVNFGTSDTGSGAVQPKKPIAAAATPVTEPEIVEPVKAAPPVQSSEPTASEEVLTAEDLESIAIKKAEAKTAKLKADADTKAKNEAEAIAKAKAQADAEAKAKAEAEAARLKKEAELKAKKKQDLDALMGGIGADDGTDTGTEGDDDTPGDKGQLFYEFRRINLQICGAALIVEIISVFKASISSALNSK